MHNILPNSLYGRWKLAGIPTWNEILPFIVFDSCPDLNNKTSKSPRGLPHKNPIDPLFLLIIEFVRKYTISKKNFLNERNQQIQKQKIF